MIHKPIDTNETALCIIDMQNGFLVEDAPIKIPNGLSIVPSIVRLIKAIRPLGVPVVWTQVSIDHHARGAYRDLWPDHFRSDGTNVLSRGSFNYEIVDCLHVVMDKSDIILHKDRYSAFFQTNLDLLLREKGISTILFAGVTTNICVESTIRDAYNRDYYSILLSDCTLTFSSHLQNYAEEVIGLCFGGVATSSEVIDLLTS